MKLSDLITPQTPTGTALFLQWEGHHVFSIPQRELQSPTHQVRFFGVGGKRQPNETLIDCALREGMEEIGGAVSQLESAEHTYFLSATGSIQPVDLEVDSVRPRLILEKRTHSPYGSMATQTVPYYLVAFNASLSSRPVPQNEIAAILYLQDTHLSLMRQCHGLTLADLLGRGARIEHQDCQTIDPSTVLTPHGTAQFLIQQLPEPAICQL